MNQIAQTPIQAIVAAVEAFFSEMAVDVPDATQQAQENRTLANGAVVQAIHAVEAALQGALAGNAIRGLRNLGHSTDPLYAARVRGKPDSRVAWPDEANDSVETLVLTVSGALRMAVCRTDGQNYMLPMVLREVRDDDIEAEDLEHLLRTLIEIIPRTVNYADRGSERYAALRQLAVDTMKLFVGVVQG